jgi:hypothetical protein
MAGVREAKTDPGKIAHNLKNDQKLISQTALSGLSKQHA